MSKLFDSIEDEDEYYKPKKVFPRNIGYKLPLFAYIYIIVMVALPIVGCIVALIAIT